MKILLITRKVDQNDGLAGFVYNWVKKIGQQVETLYVITWQQSDRGELPDNVKIINLPSNKLLKIAVLKWKVLMILPKTDGVFCHMNPEYTIIVGPLARLLGKRVVSWYMHKSVTWKMKLMEKIAHRVLSASKESFRLPSKKLVVTGHGIDTELFSPAPQVKQSDTFELLTVGRISPTKDYETMIQAVRELHKEGVENIKLIIVGSPGLPAQQAYFDSLQLMVKNMELEQHVTFLGSIANSKIPKYLQKANVFINLSGTGSLDKAVLEAMACGCLILTSNEAFNPLLPAEMIVKQNNPAGLARAIEHLINLSDEESSQLRKAGRELIIRDHNLDNLVTKIIDQFSR